MKKYSNTYIFIFSSVMVVLVAAMLSVIALQLAPVQERNVKAETMQNILQTVNIQSTRNNAGDLFRENITASYVLNTEGEIIEGANALEVDMVAELDKIERIINLESSIREQKESPFKKTVSNYINFKETDAAQVRNQIKSIKDERRLPVYISIQGNDSLYIFPMRGRGLWGPVWGYIALESDMNTVFGAVFDHKSETPGLGAEINLPWFESSFEGKKLHENGKFVSVGVIKGGAGDDDPHAVDAISGGTITSKGVESMLYNNLKSYEPYFEKKRK
jgi:Na+-transporting NADH:ubiquinone oxidoreductase subunit C